MLRMCIRTQRNGAGFCDTEFRDQNDLMRPSLKNVITFLRVNTRKLSQFFFSCSRQKSLVAFSRWSLSTWSSGYSGRMLTSCLKPYLSDVVQEVCEMARIRRGSTIIFDFNRLVSDDIILSELARFPPMSDVSVQSLALQRGTLLELFDTKRKTHDGAVILRFFNER